jgi:hypothetical protein
MTGVPTAWTAVIAAWARGRRVDSAADRQTASAPVRWICPIRWAVGTWAPR